MSVATVEATPYRLPSPVGRVDADPTRARPRRPGPGVGPAARPRRLRFVAPPAQSRACHGAAAPAPSPVRPVRARSWRLTERGMTLVLLVGAVLVTASVVVVGLTALRVTGDSYRPAHGATAPVVATP